MYVVYRMHKQIEGHLDSSMFKGEYPIHDSYLGKKMMVYVWQNALLCKKYKEILY